MVIIKNIPILKEVIIEVKRANGKIEIHKFENNSIKEIKKEETNDS